MFLSRKTLADPYGNTSTVHADCVLNVTFSLAARNILLPFNQSHCLNVSPPTHRRQLSLFASPFVTQCINLTRNFAEFFLNFLEMLPRVFRLVSGNAVSVSRIKWWHISLACLNSLSPAIRDMCHLIYSCPPRVIFKTFCRSLYSLCLRYLCGQW